MQTEDHREIIIVRRVDPGHDDGHHGGVWKIAFADFMTAMMAFFLVMWLINAANEETKKAVASYFTPIKLTDRTSNPKGVHEPKVGTPTEEPPAEKKSTLQKEVETEENGASPQAVEQNLLMDPYSALAEIAGTGSRSGGGGEDDPKAERMARNGGDGFHDLFDPHSWEDGPGLGGEAIGGGAAEADPRTSDLPVGQGTNSGIDDPGTSAAKAGEGGDTVGTQENAAAAMSRLEAGVTPGEKPAGADGVAAADPGKTAPGMPETGTPAVDAPPSDDPGGELARKLAAIAAEAGKKGLELQVVSDAEGVLIRLVDGSKPVMFDIGSARPTAQMVDAMGQIGAALNGIAGSVIVSGHTDARQYRSKTFDNWQLSTARAHMARYMLLRGGLDEKRVSRVEGHADSQPLLAADPLADANRRIEVRVLAK
jgi:chemotaxis protein MotB